ncbi:kinase-like protein [Lichtheimia hyalospora FSU 10163]|nr:kinase-like protein [Lichtheimia hyalospora FSU 10163]
MANQKQRSMFYVVKIPLRLLSTLASFLLRRPPPERSSALDTTEEPRQHSTITFRSSLTLNGFNTGKKCGSEASDVATTSSHDDDSLTQILSEWHHATPQFDPESKMTLDDFELLETLGTGTFGRVHLAKQREPSTSYYAIKVLKKAEIVRLKQIEHINSEREVLSQVNFPFIVQLCCTFQDTHNLYMVQEYVIGGELFRHLRKAGRFSTQTTQFYAAEIVLAIEYLHRKDIIYRDLKPENILLDSQGHIRITDFGFAKKVTDRTWTLCGTPEYLAPEIIQSKGHSKAVDWWALGILIYEMLAGYPPFYDDTHVGTYEKILAGKVRYPRHFDSAAKDLVKGLLVVDRTRRLGNLRGGGNDIVQHKFFRGTDWRGLLNRTVRAPLVPSHANEHDTSNFEKYPAEKHYKHPEGDPYRHLFAEF